MPCQLPVCGVIDLVQHQIDEVEPGHQARGQLDIVNDADAWVVAAAHWVSACQDTGPGIQGSNDAGLGHRHCEYLGSATKQLTEDAFLDIIQLPDAGCYAGCQLLIDVWVCAQFLHSHEAVNLCIDVKKLFRLLLSLFLAESICHGIVRLHCEHLRPLISADVDGINEGFVDTLQHAYAGVDSHALHFVDASEGDTVTRLGHVHKVVMRKQGH
ncbi:MAG: hypothetical protein FRX49_12550 [Trebouxia sp. A1-2]|nr:MAG: hypothetical protein FRX49_12550 [Trebouxia sp. A1-2]